MNVSVSAEFCNLDLVCDSIENHIVCPSDCEAPPEPVAEPERDEEGRRRSSSGRSGGGGGGGDVVAPDVVFAPEQGSASSVWSSPEDAAFSGRFSVSINGRGAVEFSWPQLGGSVRVLRAEGESFPTSPYDGGLVVYEGDAKGFEDRTVEPNQTYRYAVFYDSGGGTYGVRNLVVAETGSAFSVISLFDRAAELPPEAYAGALALAGFGFVPLVRIALARL